MDLHGLNTGYTLKDHMTKEYASPEQVAGADVDFQSDIYSIGLVFYYMLTRNGPYLNKKSIYKKIGNLNIDQELKIILEKSLALDKNER